MFKITTVSKFQCVYVISSLVLAVVYVWEKIFLGILAYSSTWVDNND